jgi:hypothetical protein
MNDKLYPKYRGPFKIVERTDRCNYIIENRLRERMAGSFPLQRLKVVRGDVDSDDYYRIDKILDDRRVNHNKNRIRTVGGSKISRLSSDGSALQMGKQNCCLGRVGLYLAFESEYNSSITDSNSIKIIERANQSKKHKCENLIAILDTLKYRSKYFLKIFDSVLNAEKVVYADRGAIWLPKCVQVDEVTLIDQVSICSDQIEVLIRMKNETFRAFL